MPTIQERSLARIDVTSGVSAFTGKGFCVVEAVTESEDRIVGQLSPDEVRAMALHWLTAAEAAEHDAMVHAELIEGAGLAADVADGFLLALRTRRACA
jgi:hypothetical protein